MVKPVESLQLRFPYTGARVDVSLWEGPTIKGKPMPSHVSIRLSNTEKGIISMNPEDALAVAAILQNYAFQALKQDAKRRIDAWRVRESEAELEKIVEDVGK